MTLSSNTPIAIVCRCENYSLRAEPILHYTTSVVAQPPTPNAPPAATPSAVPVATAAADGALCAAAATIEPGPPADITLEMPGLAAVAGAPSATGAGVLIALTPFGTLLRRLLLS